MKRDNVIYFPNKNKEKADSVNQVFPTESPPVPFWKRLIQGFFTLVWMLTVLCWPVLKWIIALDVSCRLILMFYRWSDPTSNAGWVFLLHFLVFSALTYYVSCYKPANFSR